MRAGEVSEDFQVALAANVTDFSRNRVGSGFSSRQRTNNTIRDASDADQISISHVRIGRVVVRMRHDKFNFIRGRKRNAANADRKQQKGRIEASEVNRSRGIISGERNRPKNLNFGQLRSNIAHHGELSFQRE
ncbi:hypothetical protein [Caudoviricetes sp.]|nr:hypothetical protein [Caudoviricetes sp.]UOF81546.1 hypothetical protein [Caudoviricetes sp.]